MHKKFEYKIRCSMHQRTKSMDQLEKEILKFEIIMKSFKTIFTNQFFNESHF